MSQIPDILKNIPETNNEHESVTTAEDVIDLYTQLEKLGIQIWLDGGWGVDTLLEKQTRLHKDVDIVIQDKDVPKFRELLEAKGYKEIKLDIARPHNFVLGDDQGHEIDVHVIVLNEKGDGIYGPVEKGEMYPASSLTGEGTVNGHNIKCISPDWTIKFHSGYALKEKDYRDVSALCEKFGVDLPKEYLEFKQRDQEIPDS